MKIQEKMEKEFVEKELNLLIEFTLELEKELDSIVQNKR